MKINKTIFMSIKYKKIYDCTTCLDYFFWATFWTVFWIILSGER